MTRTAGFDWETEGARIGASLNDRNCIVVVGTNPVATSRVALALGRAQSAARHVAVGDLFAESPPIQALVPTDDPHGLVDCFLYGVSLSKVAHRVLDAGELYVLPSGSEPPDYETLFPNPRWGRLAAGFREVGALFILAAPASAPHIEKLVAATDGAILVGDSVPPRLPVASVIASVREPHRPGTPLPLPPAGKRKAPASRSASSETSGLRRRVSPWIGLLMAAGLVAFAGWLAVRPLASSSSFRRGAGPPPSRTPDGAGARLAGITPVPADAPALPVVQNPGDSAQAAAFAVELMAANTQAGAILKLQEDGSVLPAATIAPVLIQGARWFKVLGGAYPTRAAADSLLSVLRARRLLDGASGAVVRAPYAFLMDSVPGPEAPDRVARYTARGLPAYALRHHAGMARVYAGAFESPGQSVLYAETLRAAGIEPVLVFRTGSVY